MEAIFHSIPVGLYRTTLDGRVLQANRTLAELLGYPSVEALFEVNAGEFYVDAADRTRSLDVLDRHGATVNFETRFKRPDGSTFWAEIFARRVDEGPAPVPFIAGMISDISKRKELEIRADRLARAADASGEIIFTTDREGLFTYVNPEFSRVYGYSAEQLVGKQTPRVLKSGRHNESDYRALWQQLLDGRIVRREITNRRQDGSLVLVEGAINPVVDDSGATTGFLAIQRDITARRQTENALHESETLFRRIFDQLPVGAALLSTDGRFHRVNAAMCAFLGFSEAELKERTFLDVTHPEERATSTALVRDLLGGRTETIDVEKRYVRKDGLVVCGAVSVRLIKDAAGNTLWTMPVVVDVTDRRRLEHQLRHAQKMEAVGQLAGGIAHDFNNILTVMLGYSELLLERHGSNELLAADLRLIEESGQRAAALTKQLLAFSRKQVLRLELTDLNHVLRNFQRLVRPIIGEDIELLFDLSTGPVILRADVAQLDQVVMNLVVNARDAMPSGGTIRIRTARILEAELPPGAHGGILAPGSYAYLAVEDTGMGMSEETKSRLFEPFFTTKAAGYGTGLGLAVVYGIVKQMGGFIFVDSHERQGTRFHIYFPLVEETSAASARAPIAAAAPRGDERILLVEDDRQVRDYAERVLRRSGYTVATAGSGLDALEYVKTSPHPNLVVTDVVMPEMSGPELAQALARLAPSIKVLFTSGYADHHAVSGNGHLHILEKPFTPTALLTSVRATLDGRSGP